MIVPAATGVVYVFTAVKGLQVIIDGPVGCENLPVTSVLHYTDALPPHELPIVVTGLARKSSASTAPKGDEARPRHTRPGLAERCRHRLDCRDDRRRRDAGRHQHQALPAAHDRRRPVAIADRAMLWLWTEYGPKKGKAQGQAAQGRRQAARQHHRPDYGMFNMPSDLAEIRRLVEGIGAEVNLVMPLGSASGRCSALVDADVNVCMYREFGRALCEALDRPYLQAPIGLHSTTKFLRTLGELLGLIPSRSSSVKSTPPSSRCGIVALGHPGLLRHRQLSPSWPTRPMPAACAISSKPRWACRARLPLPAGPASQAGQPGVQDAIAKTPPLIMFGSYNERMYMAEAGCRAIYVPASFPGAIIRRHTGTPFMGYSGATYLIQEVCNALFRRAVQHPCRWPPTSIRSTPRRRASTHSSAGRTMRVSRSTGWSSRSRCWCAFQRQSACATLPSGTRATMEIQWFHRSTSLRSLPAWATQHREK
jgi:chlorophyllide a reductase subunit Z